MEEIFNRKDNSYTLHNEKEDSTTVFIDFFTLYIAFFAEHIS